MKKFIYIIVIIFSGFNLLYSQSGMKFAEFSKRLETYFDEELIADLEKKLPQGSNYSIWGWDAGDFSGDGYYDVAFTVKIAAESRRIAHVYMFIDIDGYLTEVAQMSYEYFELPLEIGIIIKQNTCFVTKKFKQFNWEIKGYRFDNGVLSLHDVFTTEKEDRFTHDSYTNYTALKSYEKYSGGGKNDGFFANYSVIPSYPRGKQYFKGINAETYIGDVEYVTKGAYYWKGDDDASFSVKSGYDDVYLYMTIKVKDDSYIDLLCDSCHADYIEIWFDVTAQKSGNRFYNNSKDKYLFRTNAEGSSLYSIKVYPGDFLEKKAFIKDISSTDELEQYQRDAISKIKAVSSLKSDSYVLKFRIPFALFGYETSPADEYKLTELGCTVVYHDIDNEYRPEEESYVASSVFDPNKPASYGSLMLVPPEKWYGDTENIFTEDILKNLIDMGF